MQRIKLIFATVVIMAMTLVAAAAPAVADHGYEWTDWWQWRDTNWWCSTLWLHEDGEWTQDAMFCYNVNTGNIWTWP